MTGRTLIVEFHRYRGLSRAGGPLGTVVTLGWVSASFLPFLLSKWLRTRTNALRNALNTKDVPQPPQETMAVWGTPEKPYHRRVGP